MRELYATVEINKPNSQSKIKYYELTWKGYGVEIVREMNNEILISKVIENITNKKRKIKEILELLTSQLITPENAEYIEKDLNL